MIDNIGNTFTSFCTYIMRQASTSAFERLDTSTLLDDIIVMAPFKVMTGMKLVAWVSHGDYERAWDYSWPFSSNHKCDHFARFNNKVSHCELLCLWTTKPFGETEEQERNSSELGEIKAIEVEATWYEGISIWIAFINWILHWSKYVDWSMIIFNVVDWGSKYVDWSNDNIYVNKQETETKSR